MAARPETPPARIALLPELVRNQIAAGEVIERPSSVVKELVENALDAGAREVRVDLEEGGVRLVRVTDDGCGMGPEDLALAFAPHATSKLAAAEDLEHIATLGFRGEALASIGSVARCRVHSKPRGAALGHAVEDEGGRVGPVVEAGGADGTAVEVRDLFFNTPARRRFLKRTQTELARCLDVVQRLAIAHPGVGFTVTHDGRRALDVEARLDLGQRIRRVFGAELFDALVEVAGSDGTTHLKGFAAPPRFARHDTTRQMWFLNGRPVRDKLLVRCLKEAYRGFLDHGRHPAAFLLLSMDPARVDVNVHPQKSDVRFREERRVFGFLVHALREAVSRSDMATPGEGLIESARRRGGWAPAASPGGLYGAGGGAREPLQVFEIPGPAPRVEPAAAGDAARVPADEEPLAGPFLQVARTYVVRALEDGFEIVDQHALHERLTFEVLMDQARRGAVEVQHRLVPELVELARTEAELLVEHQEALARIGVALSSLGPTTIAVQGLPARLDDRDVEGLVRDLVEVLEGTGSAPDAPALMEELLHSRACRSSIMAGDALTQEEMRDLLARAARAPHDQTCPHGRPTRVRFTRADLEKAFHRR